MLEAPATLGDAHNFGRRVLERGERIYKPRTLLWEWLLLAADSPLRRALRELSGRAGLGRDAFEFLPTLKFHGARSGVGGEVERARLEPLARSTSRSRRELSELLGRSLALFSWLGVSDLHWENLVLGVDTRGGVVFGPLDVELILADLSLPTETKLLPDADPEYRELCRHAAGVRRALPYLGKPIEPGDLLAMLSHYHLALAFLERNGVALGKAIAGVKQLRKAPIRVLLRSTGDYLEPAPALWPPLLDAEAEQLARGDVPYFFRLYGARGIHYYADRALSRLKTLPLQGDVPRLPPLLSLPRGLRAPGRRRLREDGLFTLLGAFDSPTFRGHFDHLGLGVSFDARRLTITLPSGAELRAPRELGDFVSSVYLPCRCGEVRAAFVPKVTRCQPRPVARRRRG